MKKIIGFFKGNKKVLVGLIALLVVVAVLICVFVFVGGNQEKKLEKYMTEIGADFYENFYYQQIGNDDATRAEFLKNYSTIGIKVNLDNLSRYSTNDDAKNEKYAKMIQTFVNKKTNEQCNKENTKAIFYPKDPYQQKDYNLEIVLDCGFEQK